MLLDRVSDAVFGISCVAIALLFPLPLPEDVALEASARCNLSDLVFGSRLPSLHSVTVSRMFVGNFQSTSNKIE